MGKKILVSTLIILGLILTLPSSFNLFLTQEENSKFEYVIALSDSMEPTFSAGDIVKVDREIQMDQIIGAPKNADPQGDIIVFPEPGDPDDLIVHRAIRKIDICTKKYVSNCAG